MCIDKELFNLSSTLFVENPSAQIIQFMDNAITFVACIMYISLLCAFRNNPHLLVHTSICSNYAYFGTFSASSSRTMWSDSAYTMKCITPRGTSRANHRQEQAGITLFLHNAHLVYSAQYNHAHYALFRQERYGAVKMKECQENLKKEINKRYGIYVL